MHRNYADILRRCGAPLWWDDRGVPRYERFAPALLGQLTSAAALLRIRCVSCSTEFVVACHGPAPRLRHLIAAGTITWGPPPFLPCCELGPRLFSAVIEVVEFWTLDGTWTRDRDAERVFPAVHEPTEDDSSAGEEDPDGETSGIPTPRFF
jgi:hypothetical protein